MPLLHGEAQPTSEPAREAYGDDPAFRDWREYAETSGLPWYVVSTKYGLLAPEDIVPDSYNVALGPAMRNQVLLTQIAGQLRAANLSPEDCAVLDADWFQGFVAKAFGVERSKVSLLLRISPHFRTRS